MSIRKIINYFFMIISLIVFFYLQYYIFKLDVVPKKYYLIFTIVEVVLLLIAGVFSFLKRKVFSIISIILCILLTIVNIFGLYYIKHLDKFIDKGFTGDIVNISTYYLITSNNNEISSIEDITLDKTINYYVNSLNNEIARDKFGNYLYNEVSSLDEYFKNNQESCEYLLLDKVNFNVFAEINSDYNNYFKIIYEFDIETVEKRNMEVKDSYNIFIIGKDFGGRDDLNLLVTVNNNSHEVLLTSMPRDLYINTYGHNFKDSLTGMYIFGEDVVIKSIENYYNTTIDFKVVIYTENLVDIVDKIGGIDFCSPKSFTTTHAKVLDTYDDSKGQKMYVKKGCYHYNGIETLTIARERLAFNPKGDHQRQENCRQILINIVKKIASLSTLSNYSEILDSLDGLYKTNINRNTVAVLIRNVLSGINYEVYQLHVGGDLYKLPLSIERMVGYAIVPNESEAKIARAKIAEILNK